MWHPRSLVSHHKETYGLPKPGCPRFEVGEASIPLSTLPGQLHTKPIGMAVC